MKLDEKAFAQARRAIFGKPVAGGDGQTYVIPDATDDVLRRAITAYLVATPPSVYGPYGHMHIPIGLAEDEWSLASAPSDRPEEIRSVPLYALEELPLGIVAAPLDDRAAVLEEAARAIEVLIESATLSTLPPDGWVRKCAAAIRALASAGGSEG